MSQFCPDASTYFRTLLSLTSLSVFPIILTRKKNGSSILLCHRDLELGALANSHLTKSLLHFSRYTAGSLVVDYEVFITSN